MSGVEYRLLSSHAGYDECACEGRVEGRRQRHLCAGEGRVERKAGFSATYFVLFHKQSLELGQFQDRPGPRLGQCVPK